MVDHLRSGRLALAAGYASLHTTTAGHEELSRLPKASRADDLHPGFRGRDQHVHIGQERF